MDEMKKLLNPAFCHTISKKSLNKFRFKYKSFQVIPNSNRLKKADLQN